MELFANAHYLFYLIPAMAAMAAAYLFSEKRRNAVLSAVFSAENLKKTADAKTLAAKKLRRLALLSAAAAVSIAAAGPQWGVIFLPVGESDMNIMVAVDTSLSMKARDLKPSRMENTKFMLKSLADKFPGARMGIVAFSGRAYVQCPLTSDPEAIKYFIDALDTGLIPQKGTNMAEALMKSVDALSKIRGKKHIILLSDGEDFSREMDEALQYVKKNSVSLIAVGIGTREGELIPITENGKHAYKRDERGRPVVTRLNEDLFRKMAAVTGGIYIPYSNPETVAEQIKNEISSGRRLRSSSKRSAYKNRYQIFLFVGILLLFAELWPGRRFKWQNAVKFLVPRRRR